jgi:hypothetical protein
MAEFDEYFPVPTRSRERNSRPAMVRGYGSRDASTEVATSTAADEVHDLHHVSAGKGLRTEFFALAKDCAIVLDDYKAGIDA